MAGACVPSGCRSTNDCDDHFNCTIDSCTLDGRCTHTVGPNLGDTACSPGTFCTLDKGCLSAPACANTDQCRKLWADDACKSNVRCDGVSSLCLYDVLDKDGDKHPPPVCGGDDCDDSAPNTFPGAKEYCDGRDSNCNGLIDDMATCDSAAFLCFPGGSAMDRCVCRPENQCGLECPDKSTDRRHCGACGHTCANGALCMNGVCQCPPGLVDCGNTCADTMSDPAHCGGCNHACPANLATCSLGVCQCKDMRRSPCNGVCVDLMADTANCGACGNKCGNGQNCIGGACMNPPPDLTIMQDFAQPPPPDLAPPPPDLAGLCGVAGAPCCNGACGNGECCSGGLCSGPGGGCKAGGICANGACQMNCGLVGAACCANSTCGQGLRCVNNACAVCGVLGAVCCANRVCTDPFTTCNGAGNGSCAPCGAPGQPCCGGGTCEPRACCNGPLCVGNGGACGGNYGACMNGSCANCGAGGQQCCGGVGGVCPAANTYCDGQGLCTRCGEAGRPCCGGNTCNDGASYCTNGVCLACGKPPIVCCPGGICSAGCCNPQNSVCVVVGAKCGPNNAMSCMMNGKCQ